MQILGSTPKDSSSVGLAGDLNSTLSILQLSLVYGEKNFVTSVKEISHH